MRDGVTLTSFDGIVLTEPKREKRMNERCGRAWFWYVTYISSCSAVPKSVIFS